VVVDDGRTPQPARGVVVREPTSGAVLLAADMGYGAPVLSGADIAPVTIAEGPRLLGCRLDPCGKLLFTATRFSSGGKTLELEPGQLGELELPQGLYRFVNVSSGSYGTTTCAVTALRPWVFWRQQAP
jgi:hypothetical protein